jgi:hypothetical protein
LFIHEASVHEPFRRHFDSRPVALRGRERLTTACHARLAAVVIGFVLMATGVGLTVTIVMLPVGIVLGLLGVAIFTL